MDNKRKGFIRFFRQMVGRLQNSLQPTTNHLLIKVNFPENFTSIGSAVSSEQTNRQKDILML